MENTSGFSCNCSKCGRTLYGGEMLNIKGKYVCENCAESYIFSSYAGGRTAEVKPKRRVPSAFFHLLFSFHPGTGHMFLGLMKKGLFQMCMFYFCIYLTTLMPGLFGLAIPIVWIYSFFDQISTRRRVANGENVKDDISGVTSFFQANRRLVVLGAIVLVLLGGFSNFSRTRSYYDPRPERHYYRHEFDLDDYYRGGRSAMDLVQPVVLIGLGGIILFKVCKKNKPPTTPTEGGNDWTYEKMD